MSTRAGILLQGICAPLYSRTRIERFNVLVSISGRFLLAVAIAFVFNTWGRVRALGRGA
jgi:hypothetical protein